MLYGELAADGREGTRDEISDVCEARRSKLRCGVILAIEQIVDLHEELQLPMNLIAASQFEYGVSGRRPRPEIVKPVRLVFVVLISASIRTGESRHTEVDGEFRRDVNIRVRLNHMAGS